MMSSIPYDASAVMSGTVNPANPNYVVPLTPSAGVNTGTAATYMRSALTPQQQAQISVSPDATFMYQYVSPPLSSSSSPYATTSRDRITQPTAATALPNPFLDYAAVTGQLPYYCPQYFQYSLPTTADAAYQQQAQAQSVQSIDPSILGAYQLSSPPPQPLIPGQTLEGTTIIPQLLANVNTPTAPACNTSSSCSTPAGAPTGVSSPQPGANSSNSQQQQKRRLSSPLVLQQQHAQQSSRQQQDQQPMQQNQQQQVGGEAIPTAVSTAMAFSPNGLLFMVLPSFSQQASAPPIYGAVGMSDASLPPTSFQGRFVDAEGGLNGGNGGYYPSGLLTSDQHRQQAQQFYATAAAIANCYPLDFQQFYATTPRIAPTDPYWTAAVAPRHPLTWYSSSRGHPTPPPQAGRDNVQQQECYYSDLAATLHHMRLSGSGQGSGVPSERGTYSPIQYAGGWAYPTASPSSHTSSSPFPTLYGASAQQQQHHHSIQQHHGGGGGGRQGGQQGHHPTSNAAMVTATALAAVAAAASRLHQQTEFDPKELVRMVPGINPKELDPSLFRRTRYFVIKSNSTRHVMLSIQHGVWCSTLAGNDCLNRAYLSMQQPPSPKTSTAALTPSSTSPNVSERLIEITGDSVGLVVAPTDTQNPGKLAEGSDSATNESSNSQSQTLPERGRVLLFFSVNTSGCFCGVAEMTSPVDKAKQLDIWQDSRWRGAFNVRWIYAKNVPNRLLRHIQVESAENRAVTHLRDTNEILPASKGEEMLQIIHNNW
ncbi:unnamed protein product [Rodentolepis nana]|uniref:YTH domain-containing protein n=1 Tax=Rodentolepis nana TaxID=102285 RepID=A0A158QGT3_RODNA|nr:unnamed protein product [Rodentolepis nana]